MGLISKAKNLVKREKKPETVRMAKVNAFEYKGEVYATIEAAKAAYYMEALKALFPGKSSMFGHHYGYYAANIALKMEDIRKILNHPVEVIEWV